MRLVIDTNIFVSILIKPGSDLSNLIDYIDDKAIVLYSTETLTELADVLRRPKFSRYTTIADISEFVKWFTSVGELVSVEEAITGSRDTKDDKFLSLAVAGKASYLISGDGDLLTLEKIENIPIISPADFMRILRH